MPLCSTALTTCTLPWRYVTTMLGAMATLEWAAFLEERARTLTARARPERNLR
jgi:hypothetical protein